MVRRIKALVFLLFFSWSAHISNENSNFNSWEIKPPVSIILYSLGMCCSRFPSLNLPVFLPSPLSLFICNCHFLLIARASIIFVASEYFNSTDILYSFEKYSLDTSLWALHMFNGLYKHNSSSLRTSSNIFQITSENLHLQLAYYRDVSGMSYASKSNPFNTSKPIVPLFLHPLFL